VVAKIGVLGLAHRHAGGLFAHWVGTSGEPRDET
jgi:hypothetical protein